MLTVFRRHNPAICAHSKEGRDYRRCRCPLWADGTLGGKEIRVSLKTRDWNKANVEIQKWQARGSVEAQEPKQEPVTIAHATDQFLRDAKARELREPSLYKYRLLFRQLTEFSNRAGLRYLVELDLGQVRAFRASWADHNLSAMKKLERLRSFLRFCHDANWIRDNPAKKLKNPKITQPPTLPFTQQEITDILRATNEYPDRKNAARLYALVLLLRYSGLRIRDAVTLSKDRIVGDKLVLRTAKTGTTVSVPLPAVVIEALEKIPADRFYFWSGGSNPKSAVGDYQRAFRKLLKLAKVAGHFHMFRDTFATELLLSGVPLERVSVLLGHQSVKVTEKHYSPWIRARQDQLEADVRRTWESDLFLLEPETKGTKKVQIETVRPN